MAKYIGLLLCCVNFICLTVSLHEKHSCRNLLNINQMFCQCIKADGLEVKCQPNLNEFTEEEFLKITHALQERHRNLIRSNGNTNPLVTSVEISNSNIDVLYEQNVASIGSLRKLILSDNKLDELDAGLFKTLADTLLELDLTYNNLTLVTDYFKTKANLTELKLSHNRIEKIQHNAFSFVIKLETLDLSNNKLTHLDNNIFANNFKLQTLNLSYNSLTVLYPESLKGLINLERLDLGSNILHHLEDNLFSELPYLYGVDLTRNNLSHLKEDLFLNNTRLEMLLILGNPWVCDDDFNWMYPRYARKELELTSESGSWKFSNTTHLCLGGPKAMMDKNLEKWAKVMAVEDSIHNCETCKICECISDRGRGGAHVNCQNRNLTKIPIDIPAHTLLVDLSDNLIEEIEFPTGYSQWWGELGILMLDGNHIESLGSVEGNWKLKRVFKLSLKKNRLKEVPIYLLDQIAPGLSEIYLADNLWGCDCNTVRFRAWLITHHEKIRDGPNLRCSSGNEYTIGEVITNLKKQELCPQTEFYINFLDILNVFMSVMILVIVTKLGYDYWYRRRTGKFPRFLKIALN